MQENLITSIEITGSGKIQEVWKFILKISYSEEIEQ